MEVSWALVLFLFIYLFICFLDETRSSCTIDYKAAVSVIMNDL